MPSKKPVEFPHLICQFHLMYVECNLKIPSAVHVTLSRLHGSYEQLWAGQVSEALVDLTGTVTERWTLGDFGSEEEQQTEHDSDKMRRKRLDLKLLYPVKDNCALSCSTHSTSES